MIILGITGGSGCGKTTVCEILSKNGVDVIDCDKVARKIVEPKTPALSEIKSYFGDEYIQKDGTLDRKKLAALVFNSPKKLEKLNEITHKYVEEYINLYIANSSSEIIGLDAPTLIESGIYKKCQHIMCVLADKEIRKERIMRRDSLSEIDATSRISAQKADKFYIEKSDYIVYNNGDIEEIKEDILKILNSIRSEI